MIILLSIVRMWMRMNNAYNLLLKEVIVQVKQVMVMKTRCSPKNARNKNRKAESIS